MGNVTGCTKHAFGGEMFQCIPDDAEENSFYMGLGDNTVSAKSYHIQYSDYEMYMTVTSDTCVPVQQIMFGQRDGLKTFATGSFANVKAGVADTSVFDVPAGCDQGPLLPRLP